jgi:hypothetical protein
VFVSLFLAQQPLPLQWAKAFSFTRFLDHTQRRTTVSRTPLDERSARRRDFYLTTHNTHIRHSCSRLDSNPQSQQASGRRPTPYSARPLGPVFSGVYSVISQNIVVLFDFMRRFCVEAKLIVTCIRKIISET